MDIRTKHKYEDYHKMQNGIEYKKCSIHNKWFPNEDYWFPCTNEYFYKNSKNSMDGLQPYCKQCSVKKARKWIDENPEKKLESNRKDAKKPQRRKQFRDNAKRQRIEGYQKEYQQNNPDKMREYGRRNQNKKHKITKSEWDSCKVYFDYKCAYCEMSEENHKNLHNQQLHKEHVKHDGLKDLSNCVPSCKHCNSKKWQFDFKEWYKNYKHYSEERYNRILKWITDDYKKYTNKV